MHAAGAREALASVCRIRQQGCIVVTCGTSCVTLTNACNRFKRGTSLYLGADDESESEQAEYPSPSSSPDKAQVGMLAISL